MCGKVPIVSAESIPNIDMVNSGLPQRPLFTGQIRIKSPGLVTRLKTLVRRVRFVLVRCRLFDETDTVAETILKYPFFA